VRRIPHQEAGVKDVSLIDLTIPLEDGTPSFPGEPGGHFLPFASFAAQGFVAHQLLLYTHLGTHIDAPAHFLPGGAGVERWPLDQLIGPAMVVRLREGAAGEVDREDFVWPRPVREGDRVLLHTGWDRHWGSPAYFTGFPSLSPACATFLADAGVALVGMDTPTPHEHRPEEVHRILLGGGVAILEGLTGLGRIPHPFGELICLPLPLVGLDGAPVRAVFRPEGGGDDHA
jgi:arylformamidase